MSSLLTDLVGVLGVALIFVGLFVLWGAGVTCLAGGSLLLLLAIMAAIGRSKQISEPGEVK